MDIIDFSFPLTFSKLYLKVLKIIALFEGVMNACRENIFEDSIMNKEG